MNKIIAIDLDGTLLDDNLNISEENLKMLNYANDKGYKIILCTGRPLESARVFTDIINKNKIIVKYLVLLNGASVYNLYKEEEMKGYYLNIDDLSKSSHLLKKYSSYNLNLVAMNNNKFFNVEKEILTDEVIIDAKSNKMEITYLSSSDFIKANNINKAFFVGQPKDIDAIQDESKSIFDSNSDTVRSSEKIFEILPKNVNKGLSLTWLANKLKVDSSSISCIGDELNDLTMFEISSKRIAMENANERIKEISTYITSSNNNSGVAKGIEWILNND